jgi:hypothetical protein
MTEYKINLDCDIFQEFIESGYLYVDKTLFIEHFLDSSQRIMLITRPRRMGKSRVEESFF